MGRGIDEVAEADDCGRKTNGWAIESGDKDLGVRVECIGDLKIIGHEIFQRFPTNVCVRGEIAGYGDIGTTGTQVALVVQDVRYSGEGIRRKVTTFAGQDGDINVLSPSDLSQ